MPQRHMTAVTHSSRVLLLLMDRRTHLCRRPANPRRNTCRDPTQVGWQRPVHPHGTAQQSTRLASCCTAARNVQARALGSILPRPSARLIAPAVLARVGIRWDKGACLPDSYSSGCSGPCLKMDVLTKPGLQLVAMMPLLCWYRSCSSLVCRMLHNLLAAY